MHTQLRLRGHTLGLRGEHGLGQDAADDTCEGHAAGGELCTASTRDDAPEDEEGRGGILGLAEGLLVDVAEDGEGECAPYDAGCQRCRGGGTYMGCLMNMPAAAEVMAVWLYQSLYSAHSGESGRWYGNSCALFAGALSSTGGGGVMAGGGIEKDK